MRLHIYPSRPNPATFSKNCPPYWISEKSELRDQILAPANKSMIRFFNHSIILWYVVSLLRTCGFLCRPAAQLSSAETPSLSEDEQEDDDDVALFPFRSELQPNHGKKTLRRLPFRITLLCKIHIGQNRPKSTIIDHTDRQSLDQKQHFTFIACVSDDT